ncbi:copper chaperone PCu(A)C [Cognatilysobacter lacus]|uniref:Copper chaperone PCu(A)C n=1 Tax=Cognatilysobacter lacus TaxID=1643323 RepID=A0A5D8YW74_9GAMM|nr:copper chaperone PCu(A)C [Lysobacter lacus]TZF86607.1 copper chaperone PCu(A)C [Lysobacter lacus]
MRTIVLFAASLLLAFASFAPASGRHACAPVVTGAWVRMTPMMPMGAGFFTLTNPCRADIVLVGAASPRFGNASMHETRIEGGISRMRALDNVVLRPGQRVAFLPGGRHLMLMAPDARVSPGHKVRVDLRLRDGRRLPVDFDVRSAAR